MNKILRVGATVTTLACILGTASTVQASTVFSDSFQGGYNTTIWTNWGQKTPVISSFGIQDTFGGLAPSDYLLDHSGTLPNNSIVKVDTKVNSAPSSLTLDCGEDGLRDEIAVFDHNGSTYLIAVDNTISSYQTIPVSNWNQSVGVHHLELDCISGNIVVKEDGSTLGSVGTNLNYTRKDVTFGYGQGNSEFANYQYCDATGCGAPVPPVPTAIQQLESTVNGDQLQSGITNSLDAKLQAAYQSVTTQNNADAVSQLQAFIQEVQAQSGKKITTDQANQLIQAANSIIQRLS